MMFRTHSGLTLLALALLATAGMGTTATAQVTFTNPPCPTVFVANNTPCGAILRLRTSTGVLALTIPAGAVIPVAVPAAGLNIFHVVTAGGNFVPVNPPAPPPAMACGPTDWWVANVTLPNPFPPPPTCCFDVCFDPVNCRINLWPSAFPPPCIP